MIADIVTPHGSAFITTGFTALPSRMSPRPRAGRNFSAANCRCFRAGLMSAWAEKILISVIVTAMPRDILGSFEDIAVSFLGENYTRLGVGHYEVAFAAWYCRRCSRASNI